MKQVLFASSNQSKIDQFQYVANLYGYDLKVVSVYDKYPQIISYGEEYATQFEIVDEGAREIYAQAHEPIVVEDTIFEVDALDGRPGLRANVYLKEKGRTGLLQELQGEKNRNARITSIAGYFDGKRLVSVKNVVKGKIAKKESYREGEPSWVGPTFNKQYGGGFSSIFIPDGHSTTLADLKAAEYAKLGYRDPNFKVLLQILPYL